MVILAASRVSGPPDAASLDGCRSVVEQARSAPVAVEVSPFVVVAAQRLSGMEERA